MTAPTAIVALDVGTSRVKGACFDVATGRLLFEVATAMPPLVIDGLRAEQSPDEVLSAVRQALRELAKVPSWKALALTTQRGTMMCGDETGTPLTGLWSWLDRRGEEVGGDRWRWLEAKTKLAPKVRHVWSLASWLAWKLTGASIETVVTRPADADRTKDVVAKPKVVAAGFARPMIGIFATRLGIPEGLPLVVASGDKNAELVGAGVVAPGDAALSFGTAVSLGMLSRAGEKAKTQGVVLRTPSLIKGLTQWEVGLPFGGAVPGWVETELRDAAPGATAAASREPHAGAFSDPAPDAPFFLPYLRGAFDRGDLTARWVPDRNADPATLLRAAHEGVLLDVLRQAPRLPEPVQRISLVGGPIGAARLGLAQWTADAFQVPVILPASERGGVVGAAMAAAVALGLEPDFAAAKTRYVAGPEGEILPRPERRAPWEARLSAFVRAAGLS